MRWNQVPPLVLAGILLAIAPREAAAQLPDPGMEVDITRTALVITDTFSSPLEPIGPYALSGSFTSRRALAESAGGSNALTPRVAFLRAIV